MQALVWTDEVGTVHEIHTATVFICGVNYGIFQYDSGRADIRWHRCGAALYCRICGDVWARFATENSKGQIVPFNFFDAPCEQHQDMWGIAGSVLVDYIEHLLDVLPPKIVRRELEVHLNYYEKGTI